MPLTTAPRSDAERQRDYKRRIAANGRTRVSLVVSVKTADQLHALAEQRAEAPGRTLEHVLDVVAPTPLSPRQRARMDRRITEVMAIVDAGERHMGGTDLRARRRTARRLGGA